MRSAQLDANRLPLTELDELIVLAEQDTDALLMDAAAQGLFAERQPWRYPATGSECKVTLTVFKQHARQIRLAQSDDLPALLALEQQCWLPALQATQQQLAFRLSVYPDGQLVLVHNGQLVGVIYSQRLADADTVYRMTAEQACEDHNAQGPVLHLLVINIVPAYQHAGFGDALLEFALQRASVTPGIAEVIAVTLCRDYDALREPDLSLYIEQRNPQGRLIDPVLRFHELHGAQVTGLVPGYRPKDVKNLGYGVLVRYQIHSRRRDELQSENAGNTLVLTWQDVSNTVTQAIQACLGNTRSAAFSPNQPLLMMGLDSADLLQLAERLSSAFQLRLEQGFFFHYTTSEKIAQALFKRLEQKATLTQRQEPHADDIAIIGISGRYPKADDVQAFWQNLKAGVDAISEVPLSRWDYRHFDTSRYGGFINDVAAFDPLFFNISPSEAEAIDPQERLFLQTAWHTIEDAAITAPAYNRFFKVMSVCLSVRCMANMVCSPKTNRPCHLCFMAQLLIGFLIP
ncbi:GNAT family N-acetyltransferase [Methylocucumis oryzae]|uniref:GNAT family N-acetyltransferase n=1 Tax=Methylocucumis oryzae TaxID=1632867 RepID=UPI000696E0A9|nr:GNAT family N-acetyltransferase [Methylocucumis oryzae]